MPTPTRIPSHKRPAIRYRTAPALPDETEVRAARATVARHRRRRYPDQSACGFCGGPWRSGVTYTGRPVAGCFRRRHAVDVLDVAGWVTADGRLTAPGGVSRG